MSDPESLPYRPCVGVVLIDARGLVFAGQRIDSPSPAWQMPQGGIDKDETPKTAAFRELWEETGVTRDLVTPIAKTHGWVTYDLPPDLLGKVWGGKYRGQRQKWFLFRFNGRDSDIKIATEHPEFSTWRWILADEMVDSIVPFKRAVYDEVIRSFRAYLAKTAPSPRRSTASPPRPPQRGVTKSSTSGPTPEYRSAPRWLR